MTPPINISQESRIHRKFSERNRKKFYKLLQRIDFKTVEPGDLPLLYEILPSLEQYADVFDDDTVNITQDYDGWVKVVLDFIEDVHPWFQVVTLDGKPQGVMWVNNWESYGSGYHSCEYGGLVNRQNDPFHSQVAMWRYLSEVFDKTGVYIIRSEFAQENRAVSIALRRLGFSHPEPRRALKIREGKEITGTILSVTRPEWEALHEQKEERESPEGTSVSAV